MHPFRHTTGWHSRRTLRRDLEAMGLRQGDVVMAHAAMRSVGRLQGGVDALIDAVLDVVGPEGTLMVYTDWAADYLELADSDGRVPPEWRDHVAAFDPCRSRASRENGVLPEWTRTRPGAMRSANPGASVAALGAQAADLTVDHALDYGYGDGAPLSRLVDLGGRVLMVGAPWDTMTLLHHAEHLADVPDKRTVRGEVPILLGGDVVWREFEEYDTEQPVVAGLDEDFFATIVEGYVGGGGGTTSPVGDAPSLLVDARAMVEYGVGWLEAHPAVAGAAAGGFRRG